MNILVLASGGFDSTTLLHRAIVAGHKVTALYVNTTIDDAQKKAERFALKNICHFLSHNNMKSIDCWPIEVDMPIFYADMVPLQQPQLWTYAAYLFSQLKENNSFDEVQLGYIMEDHALSYLDEIKQLWTAFNAFQHSLKSNKIPQITFPLIKWSKEMTIKYVVDNLPEIAHHITFCETPTESGPCKRCHSCKKTYEAGYELQMANLTSHLEFQNKLQYNFIPSNFIKKEMTKSKITKLLS